MDKLKRCVIKEELVALTGDYKKALILNQMLYWTERVKDYDKFLKEEQTRIEKNGHDSGDIQVTHGWIYKTAEELSAETMLGLSKSNMLKHINEVVNMGYMSKRTNPRYKWDKTFQYRVDVFKIQVDLFKLGYTMEGYPMLTDAVLKQYKSFESELLRSTETELHTTEIEQQYQRLLTEIKTNIINNKDNKERHVVPFYNWLTERD